MKFKYFTKKSTMIFVSSTFILGQFLSSSPTLASLTEVETSSNIELPANNFQIMKQAEPSVPVIVLAMGSSNTSKITGTINRGKNQCASVPAEYQADCLSQTFRSASRVSNAMVDYTKAGKELSSANKQIDALVSKNLDKNAPTIRKGGRTLRAIKKSAITKVSSKTKTIIASTASKLIRAAGNSKKRKIHFSRIAKAVDSTKVILRSA